VRIPIQWARYKAQTRTPAGGCWTQRRLKSFSFLVRLRWSEAQGTLDIRLQSTTLTLEAFANQFLRISSGLGPAEKHLSFEQPVL